MSARPATPALTGPTTVCKSQTAVAYSFPAVPTATSYSWSVTGGGIISPSGTSASVNYTTATSSSAIVRVNAINACGASQPGTVIVNVNLFCRTAGNDSQLLKGELSAYPNPTSGKVIIEFNSETETNVILTITDITGKSVMNEIISAGEGSNTKDLDLGNLAKGIYMLSLKTDELVSQTIRLVVE